MSRLGLASSLILLLGLLLAPTGGVSGAAVTNIAAQSSISVYVSCPSSVAFSSPLAAGTCPAGNFTAVAGYTGVSQVVASNLTSLFYLASAQGGVKVAFSVTDITTGKPLIQGVAYGAPSGGTCANPNLVTPFSTTVSNNEVNSGDTLNLTLDLFFTPNGAPSTPAFCSGGSGSTLVALGTTVAPGQGEPLATSTLVAGNARQSSLSGYNGVSETYSNLGSSTVTAVVIGVLKGAAGDTVDILHTSVTVSPGENATAFFPFVKSYPSGSYTLTAIAVSVSYVPLSTSSVATVTL